MELQQVYELMERFQRSGLTELEWSQKDEKILLRKELSGTIPGPVVQPAVQMEETAEKECGEAVTAPLVGTFYAAPAPEEPPFVNVGRQVKRGETLCLIEAMKMMSEISAPADCVVEEILVENGAAVSYGQPLFRIRRI